MEIMDTTHTGEDQMPIIKHPATDGSEYWEAVSPERFAEYQRWKSLTYEQKRAEVIAKYEAHMKKADTL